MKKILLITFLMVFTFSFAQQREKGNGVVKKNQSQITLQSVSAYPNPFNVKTNIKFKSTKTQNIEFSIKNILGKTVYYELVNCKTGFNTIPFNRRDLKKGMYIYSLQTEEEIISKRLVIR